MLGWMHENELHRGFLELPTGEPLTPQDIALKIGRSIDEVNPLLCEMRRIGIFSTDDRGCIFSRRMARETHISQVRRDAAKSRAERANRAANGSFAGGFAGANTPAKEKQNPTVTASDSVTDTTTHQEYSGIQDSTTHRLAASKRISSGNGNGHHDDWKLAAAAVQKYFPATEDEWVATLAHKSAAVLPQVGRSPDELTDKVLADAVEASHRPNQKSAALFFKTVPITVLNWGKR